MSTITLDLDDDLATLLREAADTESVAQAARELMVLELYRRRTISSGKAAQLLGMPRAAFIEHASRLGIPFFTMTPEDWEAEVRASEQL